MRGTVAKRIRRDVYGDMAVGKKRYRRDENGKIENIGLRKDYLDAKKAYYKGK